MGEPQMSRAWAADQIGGARVSTGTSWAQLAEVTGRSVVWTTFALLGQQPVDEEMAQRVAGVLGLADDAVFALQLPPVRGAAAADRTEPVVYRLEEMVQCTDLHSPN